jgi:hypothetical protein
LDFNLLAEVVLKTSEINEPSFTNRRPVESNTHYINIASGPSRPWLSKALTLRQRAVYRQIP